jgi:hypothetical protein
VARPFPSAARSGHEAVRAPGGSRPGGPLLLGTDFPVMWVGAIGVVQVGPRLPFISPWRFTEPWGGKVK